MPRATQDGRDLLALFAGIKPVCLLGRGEAVNAAAAWRSRPPHALPIVEAAPLAPAGGVAGLVSRGDCARRRAASVIYVCRDRATARSRGGAGGARPGRRPRTKRRCWVIRHAASRSIIARRWRSNASSPTCTERVARRATPRAGRGSSRPAPSRCRPRRRNGRCYDRPRPRSRRRPAPASTCATPAPPIPTSPARLLSRRYRALAGRALRCATSRSARISPISSSRASWSASPPRSIPTATCRRWRGRASPSSARAASSTISRAIPAGARWRRSSPTARKWAIALGVEEADGGGDADRAHRPAASPTIDVAREDAPCKEVVMIGDEVDLTRLPAMWTSEKDPGRYIAAGMCIIKDPDTGIRNMSFHRAQIIGPDRTAFLICPRQALKIFEMYGARGRPMEVAMVIGAHPLIAFAAGLRRALWPRRADHRRRAARRSRAHGQMRDHRHGSAGRRRARARGRDLPRRAHRRRPVRRGHRHLRAGRLDAALPHQGGDAPQGPDLLRDAMRPRAERGAFADLHHDRDEIVGAFARRSTAASSISWTCAASARCRR